MSLQRFVKRIDEGSAPGPSMVEVRQWLWDEIGLKGLYRGDGHTYDDMGARGPMEFLARNAPLADIEGIVVLDVVPSASPSPVLSSPPISSSLRVIDLHCAGEPARVVVGGLPAFSTRNGDRSMAAIREEVKANHDGIRKLLLLEPRGYPCQNANLIFPSSHPEAAFGFVILEQNQIYPMMSGHNAICVATALLETGMVPMNASDLELTAFVLEAPVGLITFRARCSRGKVLEVELTNQPAWCEKRDALVKVPAGGVGNVLVDIAFGGMWYAIVNAEETARLGLELIPSQGKAICRLGEMIKVACREQHPVNHPSFDYPGVDIIVFRGPAPGTARASSPTTTSSSSSSTSTSSSSSSVRSRNAVVMSNAELRWDDEATWGGMIDRSPCGTGTCAVMASMRERGELGLNQDFVHESILGTTFRGRLVSEATVVDERSGSSGNISAVVPTIAGRAWITQYCDVVCDPSDPFPEGYTCSDIWASE